MQKKYKKPMLESNVSWGKCHVIIAKTSTENKKKSTSKVA